MSSTALPLRDFDRDASLDSLPVSTQGLLGGRRRPRLDLVGSVGSTTDTSAAGTTTGSLPDLGYVGPVVTPPEVPRMDSAVVLQKWEGRVDEVVDDGFVATLTDLSNEGPDELAEFPMSEVSRHDVSLVVPGAIFYWSVGYRDAVTGQRTHESVLRFRRLPRWTATQRKEAADQALAWKERLHWCD